jgi:lipopolysaccharide transport system ATP-binding protein
MRPIIKVEYLGKRYRIGQREPYRTIRDSITRTVASPWRGLRARFGGQATDADTSHVWALRDVNFEVMPGEVLGIIGRNGAGKSTLLKVLSRITEPTTGRIELYGRVGSLLEVGTGFHPELTGRENIQLSGAIMGMRRTEIARKFDRIVAFAEVERFVDTPVKRYSSGMYVRLAFAVAAHLDPEILLVDEVLAVGDGAFQKKCLGKMSDVAREGRTVILVSHNMASIESLCTMGLMLESGRVTMLDEVDKVLTKYSHSPLDIGRIGVDLASHPGRRAGCIRVMQTITVSGAEGSSSPLRMGDAAIFQLTFESPDPIRACFALTLKTDRGFRIFHVSDRNSNQLADCEPVTGGVVICEIPDLPLMPGQYTADLWLEDFSVMASLDMIVDAVSFEVIPSDSFGTGRLPPPSEGPVWVRASWRFERRCDVVAANALSPGDTIGNHE